LNPFRSVRTPSGWSTVDLFPNVLQNGSTGPLKASLLGASADGSTALVASSIALDPSAFADQREAELEGWCYVSACIGQLIYRVTADGTPPQMVTQGDFAIPSASSLQSQSEDMRSVFAAISATPDLNEVAFKSLIPLERNDTCNNGSPQGEQLFSIEEQALGTTYLWNASSVAQQAHTLYFGERNFSPSSCNAPNVLGVSKILPDGRPILTPNPAGEPGITETVGPLVENYPDISATGQMMTDLAGPSGGSLLSVTPDGSTAYVQAADAIDSKFPKATTGTYNLNLQGEYHAPTCTGGCQIYAVSTTLGTGMSGTGATPGVTCISCSNGPAGPGEPPVPDEVNVTYLGTSKDGGHVLFTTDQGLWEWDQASGAELLTPPATPVTDLGPQTVVVSENGKYVVGLTSQLANNPNGTADLYKFVAGQQPELITSGKSADDYRLYDDNSELPNVGNSAATPHVVGGVSNDGARIVYERQSPGAACEGKGELVIDEWIDGETGQISPQVSPSCHYVVQAIAGDELQDVFFLAFEPIVPWDFNAGQADVYDAHVDGSFSFCTPGNPGPPPGAERCGAATSNANPTVPGAPAYPANLTPPSVQLTSLPADTSQPANVSKPKALTRTQKLAKALKACKRKPKKQRAACNRQARSKYAPTKKKGKGKR